MRTLTLFIKEKEKEKDDLTPSIVLSDVANV
jgi:hypothetical protein